MTLHIAKPQQTHMCPMTCSCGFDNYCYCLLLTHACKLPICKLSRLKLIIYNNVNTCIK